MQSKPRSAAALRNGAATRVRAPTPPQRAAMEQKAIALQQLDVRPCPWAPQPSQRRGRASISSCLVVLIGHAVQRPASSQHLECVKPHHCPQTAAHQGWHVWSATTHRVAGILHACSGAENALAQSPKPMRLTTSAAAQCCALKVPQPACFEQEATQRAVGQFDAAVLEIDAEEAAQLAAVEGAMRRLRVCLPAPLPATASSCL